MVDIAPDSILLIERDVAERRWLQLRLLGWGYDVAAFGDAESALASDLAGSAAALVVGDLPDALALVKALRARGWQGTAILLAESLTPALRARAREAGFACVLEKPVRLHLLRLQLGRDRPVQG